MRMKIFMQDFALPICRARDNRACLVQPTAQALAFAVQRANHCGAHPGAPGRRARLCDIRSIHRQCGRHRNEEPT